MPPPVGAQAAGIAKKKVTVLSVFFVRLHEKYTNWTLEDFAAYHKETLQTVIAVATKEKGHVQSFMWDRLDITFNIERPCPLQVPPPPPHTHGLA